MIGLYIGRTKHTDTTIIIKPTRWPFVKKTKTEKQTNKVVRFASLHKSGTMTKRISTAQKIKTKGERWILKKMVHKIKIKCGSENFNVTLDSLPKDYGLLKQLKSLIYLLVFRIKIFPNIEEQ